MARIAGVWLVRLAAKACRFISYKLRQPAFKHGQNDDSLPEVCASNPATSTALCVPSHASTASGPPSSIGSCEILLWRHERTFCVTQQRVCLCQPEQRQLLQCKDGRNNVCHARPALLANVTRVWRRLSGCRRTALPAGCAPARKHLVYRC